MINKGNIFYWIVYLVAIVEAELVGFTGILLDNLFAKVATQLGRAGIPFDDRYAEATARCFVLLGVLTWSLRLVALATIAYGFRTGKFSRLVAAILASLLLVEAKYPNLWIYIYSLLNS